MANFVYLFAEGDRGLLVDPAFEVPEILRRIEAAGVGITHVLATHGHPDHIHGIEAVKRATGAKVLGHESADHPIDERLRDGDILDVAGLRIEILHTPGHRFDSVCAIVDGTHLVTGDTLFVGECGRVRGEGPARR